MTQFPLTPEQEAELTATLDRMKANGLKWQKLLDKGEEMFKRHQQQLKQKAKAF